MVLYCDREKQDTRIGIIASKKVGNSVKRHRAKRLIKEAFRLLAPSVKPINVVIIARRSVLRLKCQDVQREMTRLLQRVEAIEAVRQL